jgi:hypothetical protein
MKQICRGTLPSKPAWASEVLAWMGEVQADGLSVQPQQVGTQYLGGKLWLHPTSATVPSQNLRHN